MRNFSYLVADLESKTAAVFDPAWEIPKLVKKVNDKSLTLKWIINTHAHYDHSQGNSTLQKATGAMVLVSSRSKERSDILVRDGQKLALGKNVTLTFIHTPGHSPESMCIVVNNVALITGDTLFIGECGRVDLEGGSAAELFDSFEKIRKLNPELIVYPGHDYGPKQSTTLREQLETNYTLERRSKDEFIDFMKSP
jgi:hydroxyacylglutathione hydrolase